MRKVNQFMTILLTLTLCCTLGAGPVYAGDMLVAGNLDEDIRSVQDISSLPQITLGVKEQKVADVIIKESKAGAILDRVAGENQDMVFYLDRGFRFARVPRVEIRAGDMVVEVGEVKIETPAGGRNLLIIPVRAGSYQQAATISISEIYLTADRNAPGGEVRLWAAESSTYPETAFEESKRSSFQYDSPGSVVLAINATAPPQENRADGSAVFVIGSNMYKVNGSSHFMEVAPYLKNGYSYIPLRCLALALNVPESDIVWDAAAQQVTITRGETLVEVTVNSNKLVVNGEPRSMDAALELKEGRIMLPARYLAEALGAEIGWDGQTSTVVLQF